MSFNSDNQRGGGWHEGSADSASTFRARGGAEIQARAAVRALDSARDAFLTLDSDFRIMYANAEAARINGKPVEAFLGRTHWEEWPDSVGTPVESCYRRAMADRTPVYFEHHYFVPDQLDLWAAISVYPDAKGGGLHLVYRDITERMRGETARRPVRGGVAGVRGALPRARGRRLPDRLDQFRRRQNEWGTAGMVRVVTGVAGGGGLDPESLT